MGGALYETVKKIPATVKDIATIISLGATNPRTKKIIKKILHLQKQELSPKDYQDQITKYKKAIKELED